MQNLQVGFRGLNWWHGYRVGNIDGYIDGYRVGNMDIWKDIWKG